MQRVFLDANVLFSAAYRADAGLAKLWKLRSVTLITSGYAMAEAMVNLETPEQRRRLEKLAAAMEVIAEPAAPPPLPTGMKLPEKDRPILAAAIATGASVLLTGDVRHFGEYFGKTCAGVTILMPAEYLQAHKGR